MYYGVVERCGALVRQAMCLHDRITTCSENEFLYFLWGIPLSVSNNIISPAPKNYHLAQAEKNTYASKPFDLLEIVIIMLR